MTVLKKILLLGGSAQQVIAIKTAKRLGYYTVLCDYLLDNPGQYVADKYYNVSTTDVEAVCKVAMDEKVDGILAYASDPAALPAAIVAERLGLPTNPSASVAVLGVKHNFRKFLSENAFACPRNFTFNVGADIEEVKEAAEEMLDYNGSGMSVMEMSHRSKAYDTIIKEAEADLRELMNIPDNYKVLFLQGGASQQFAMIPMNLMKNRVADYIVTGQWAKKAYQEASLYGKANKIASSEDKTFSYIPDCSDLPISEDADYVYICENNTIYGTKFKTLPNTKGKPLVADVSSCFLSEPVDVTKYGVIYGGVQKNIGPAGVVIVIIREDLITEDVLPGTPTMLRYKIHADADSLYNTPPAYGIYICGKVFKWLKKMGGLEAMKERNEKKAKILYDYLDESKLFKGTVRKEDRSLMNVPFITGNEELDAKFVKEAKEAGFENLKGHRTVGGMRASIYNAMPIEGVEKLVEFMKKFEAENA